LKSELINGSNNAFNSHVATNALFSHFGALKRVYAYWVFEWYSGICLIDLNTP